MFIMYTKNIQREMCIEKMLAMYLKNVNPSILKKCWTSVRNMLNLHLKNVKCV